MLLNLITTIACGQKSYFSPQNSKTIDSILLDHSFNGVVLIKQDSITLYSKTMGFSNLEKKTKLQMTDQFVIGSISKQITAVLVLREFEKGNIGLYESINQYLTKSEKPWINKVTVHHLLTHTHGIEHLESPLEFEPGSQFHYSQLGYDLLAQILESITGKSFEQLSTELFTEFGFSHTFHPENENYMNLVNGYEENENDSLVIAKNSLENYPAAGSFISTVEDLAKWNRLLHTGRLLKPETRRLMKTNHATRVHPIFNTVQYGYGLLFKEGEQDLEIGTLGYAPGFVSASYYYPKTKINLVILSNTATDLNDLKRTFMTHTKVMGFIKSYGHSIH